jgi:hypothetical protein
MNRSFPRATALVVALTFAFPLGGCDPASIDAKIAANASASLPAICSLGVSAHAAFTAVAATSKLARATVSDEAAAYSGLQTLCANPPQNLSDAIAEAGAIYASIANSLAAAQAVR